MMSREHRSTTIALAGIVAFACLLAIVWIVRVPLLLEPDERSHADYAFAIVNAGGPFWLSEAVPQFDATPQIRYLAGASHFRELRFDRRARESAGYGSASFFSALDRDAPQVARTVPAVGSSAPVDMFNYPAPYYILVAFAIGVVERLTKSITGAVFGARALGLVALALTVVMAYRTFRLLHCRKCTALAATAGVAFFPLTTWVCTYIQPDAFTGAVMAWWLAAALAWKNHPASTIRAAEVAFALVLLCGLKEHFAAAAVACTILLAVSLLFRKSSPAMRPCVPYLVLAISIGALVAAPALVPVKSGSSISGFALVGRRHAIDGISTDPATAAAVQAFASLRDALHGDVQREFWMQFGENDQTIFPQALARPLLTLFAIASALLFLLLLARQVFVIRRLAVVGRQRSWRQSLSLACGDPVLGAYVAVTGVLFGANVFSGSVLFLQGRYWFPVLVPLIALGVVYLPRVLRRVRRRASLAFAVAYLAYDAVAVPFGLIAIQNGFYSPPSGPPPLVARWAAVDTTAVDGRRVVGQTIEVGRASAVRFGGWAVDDHSGLPARAVILDVDGKPAALATLRVKRPDLTIIYNDWGFGRAGFAVRLHVASLRPGSHTVTMRIAERDGSFLQMNYAARLVVRAA